MPTQGQDTFLRDTTFHVRKIHIAFKCRCVPTIEFPTHSDGAISTWFKAGFFANMAIGTQKLFARLLTFVAIR